MLDDGPPHSQLDQAIADRPGHIRVAKQLCGIAFEDSILEIAQLASVVCDELAERCTFVKVTGKIVPGMGNLKSDAQV
jgi:hypothetical protein